MKRAWIGPIGLIASLLALRSAPSGARDAERVQHVVVGRGSALSACEGIDASNGNHASSDFPRTPQVVFRTRLGGGIGQAPASDAHGNLLIVHSEPRLSKLDARGRTLWSERLGSEASAAPVLTSSGTIVVVSRDGEAAFYSTAGQLQIKRALPLSDPRRRSLTIPAGNGGAWVASGSELLQLDEQGTVLRKMRARSAISTIAEANAQLVSVCENGDVQVARATGDLELIGTFGGRVPEGAALSAGKVLAVVDGHKWCALDLQTGRVTTLANEQSLTLSGPPALLEAPSAALAAGGFVSIRGKDGTELGRIALSVSNQGLDPSTRGLRPALVVSDRQGAVAAVQGESDALVLRPGGSALRLDDTNCLEPFRPTPTKGGLVFACRSGQLFGVSDKGP